MIDFIPCEKCRDSPIVGHIISIYLGEEVVNECECWHIWKQKKQLEIRLKKSNLPIWVEDFTFDKYVGEHKRFILSRMKKYSEKNGLKNCQMIERLPETSLVSLINQADITLGIFGNSIKSNIVIPNKAFASIAMKKALITARTPAIVEIFQNNENAILCKKNNAISLTNAILKLYNNPKLTRKIANNGYNTYIQYCTPQKIGQQLYHIFLKLLNTFSH